MPNNTLDNAKILIKQGKSHEAALILKDLIKADPNNVDAWFWYVESLADLQKQIRALELCLKYNPENLKVAKALSFLQSKNSSRESSRTVQKNKKKNRPPKLIITLFVAFSIVLMIAIFAVSTLIQNEPNKIAATSTRRVSTSTPRSTSTIVPTKVFVGKWETSFDKSEFDDSQIVNLHVQADDLVEGWLTSSRPILNIRCKEGELDVYIILGMSPYVESPIDIATVRIRFDSSETFDIKTNISTDGEAVFFPNPNEMTYLMLHFNKMIFGFTPFNASPVVTSFNLQGLSNVIEPLLASCNTDVQQLGPQPTFTPTSSLTKTPLPIGSSIVIDNMEVKIERIEIVENIQYSENYVQEADGRFVILFLAISNNIGRHSKYFSTYDLLSIKDAEGNIYKETIEAAIPIAEKHGLAFGGGEVDIGSTIRTVAVFDISENSEYYLLVPGWFAEQSGESLFLQIP